MSYETPITPQHSGPRQEIDWSTLMRRIVYGGLEIGTGGAAVVAGGRGLSDYSKALTFRIADHVAESQPYLADASNFGLWAGAASVGYVATRISKARTRKKGKIPEARSRSSRNLQAKVYGAATAVSLVSTAGLVQTVLQEKFADTYVLVPAACIGGIITGVFGVTTLTSASPAVAKIPSRIEDSMNRIKNISGPAFMKLLANVGILHPLSDNEKMLADIKKRWAEQPIPIGDGSVNTEEQGILPDLNYLDNKPAEPNNMGLPKPYIDHTGQQIP